LEKSERLVSLSDLIELSALNSQNDSRGSNSHDVGADNAKLHLYRHTQKPDRNECPRNWRTRKDPFERVWDEIKLKLEFNLKQTAKALLKGLVTQYPTDFKPEHIRTLPRRVADW
jgi:hypothetical protein